MQLQTTIDIPKDKQGIGADDKIMLIGSCFADEIGQKMVQSGFDVMVNPFGTLYNPVSIAGVLLRCVSEVEYTEQSAEVFCGTDGVWHSWMHHSRFSAPTAAELVANINKVTNEAAQFLAQTDVLIVTLGTAIIYRLAESGMLVANCHKQPDSLFVRERLSASSISSQWSTLIQQLQTINPKLRVIFTVSPIRHKRDGMHVNQISKGILLQAVDEAAPLADYFPSYEIMMDELRDYRFYADDMVHPSPLAVEYIWQRFQDTYFSAQTKNTVALRLKEYKRTQHRTIIK